MLSSHLNSSCVIILNSFVKLKELLCINPLSLSQALSWKHVGWWFPQLTHIPLERVCFKVWFSELWCCLCRGFIALENKTFITEPVPGSDTGAHFIYRVEELRLTPGACGHGFNMSSVAPESHIKSPFQSFHTRVRLVMWSFVFSYSCSPKETTLCPYWHHVILQWD